MADGKIVVALDIGTSKIVTVIAKLDEESTIHVLGVSEIRSAGIRKGQIVDIEDAVLAINTSLESAERMAGYSISHVITSIGGSHIESLNSKGVVAVSNPQGEINSNDVNRVVDAARAVSLPSSREIIHVLPRNYTVDGQEGIKDPTGMTGIRLEVDTHIISASSTAVRNLEKALSEVGIDVDSVVFSGYASSLSVLSETEKELGVILVDIGAGTTDIAVYVEGSIAYSSVLPIGARHITNDLAIGLRVSLESAEKIKLFLSRPKKRVMLGEHDLEEQEKKDPKHSDELDLSHLNLPEDMKKVSQKTLIEGIIRPRLNEIFTMIGQELKKSGLGGQTPAGVVITGGGAKTVGIVDSAKRMLAMPVRIGQPANMKGIVDEVEDPAFAAIIGPKQSFGLGISLPKIPGFKKFPSGGKLGKKIMDLIKSFIP
jgi:cell division protein FtsA